MLSRSSGQVSHVLLTRSPLELHQCCHRMVPARLACVRHAASVRPEPGSNSPSRSWPPNPDLPPGSGGCDRRAGTGGAHLLERPDMAPEGAWNCMVNDHDSYSLPAVPNDIDRDRAARWAVAEGSRGGDRPHWLFRPLFRFQGARAFARSEGDRRPEPGSELGGEAVRIEVVRVAPELLAPGGARR